MFNQSTNPNLKKKSAGMFGAAFNQYTNESDISPTPDEAARGKYAPKSEFNDSWLERRRRDGKQMFDITPAMQVLAGDGQEETPAVQRRNLFEMSPKSDPVDDPPQGLAPLSPEVAASFTPSQTGRGDAEQNKPLFQISPIQTPTETQPTTTENKPLFDVSPSGKLGDQRQRYEDAVLAPVQKQGLGKQILFQILQGVGNAASAMQGGGMQPVKFLGQARHDAAVNQEAAKLAPLEAQYQQDLQNEANKAKTANIYADNELNKEKLQASRENAVSRIQAAALTKVSGLKWFDPNNSAHRRLAETAGLDIESLQDWDDRNSVTKQVAGVTYQYNRKTNSFEPSNLPADDAATLTDYQVKTPAGELRTYRVAQKDAARFSVQMQALGIQIEAANTRQANQQNWQSGENEKNRSQAATLSRERIQLQRESLEAAQKRYDDAVTRNDEKAQKQEAKNLREEKLKAIRLKAFLKSNKLTATDADLMSEIEDLDK